MGGLVVADDMAASVFRGDADDAVEDAHGQHHVHNTHACFLQLLAYSCSEDTSGVTFAAGW